MRSYRNAKFPSGLATRRSGVIGLLLAVAVVAGTIAAQRLDAQDRPEAQRKILAIEMEKKLKRAQALLTCLAFEDFDALADNARSLKQIGEQTLAKVTPDLAYVKYSAEFVSLADELERRAKDKDLNGATLSYIRLTINCVECHKRVRDGRILDPKP
ncbi:MAG: hypothetical protein P4L84_34860 [Isosphaeraceae bacterium]|nr:hypothetical protein [Isosphaeraceae bacterium]